MYAALTEAAARGGAIVVAENGTVFRQVGLLEIILRQLAANGSAVRAQRVGDSNSMLVASGKAKTFAEYDRYGLPIATYEMEAEKYIYRVYKYEL